MRIIDSRRKFLFGGGKGTFTIKSLDSTKSVSCEFDIGMTWSDFVASDYNDGKFTFDSTTPLQLQIGVSETNPGFVGYNGFTILLNTDTSSPYNFICHPNIISQMQSMYPNLLNGTTLPIENGKTYYCDGVGYVPPEATYIYKPGYTAFQNAVSSGANGSFSYSFSTSYISGRFGGALSAGHSLYIGIRMKDYSKIKIDFQNLSGGTTNIGYATSSTATTLSGQKTFSGSARTVAEIDISSVTTTSTRYLIFGGPSGNSSYRIYEISLV